MKKFSVITVNYNNGDGLRKTMLSVLAQSFEDYEYIIIDGGSTDESVKIIEMYTDEVDYWVSEPDEGIYHAMNKGVRRAKGEYLVFMNSGDCFHDSFVLSWVATQKIEEEIAIGKVYCTVAGRIKEAPDTDCSMMDLYRNHPPHQAAFLKRVLFDDGLFDESFRLVSDWVFLIDRMIFKNCSYRYLDRIIADYDMEGVSSTSPQLLKKEETRVLETLLPARIRKDYEKYKNADSPLLALIPELNKTAGFHRMVFLLVKFLLCCYKRVTKI